MPYKIVLPNGAVVEVDDSVPLDQAKKTIFSTFPEFAPKTELLSKQGIKTLIERTPDLIKEGWLSARVGHEAERVRMLEQAALEAQEKLPGAVETKLVVEKAAKAREELGKLQDELQKLHERNVETAPPRPSYPYKIAEMFMQNAPETAATVAALALSRGGMPAAAGAVGGATIAEMGYKTSGQAKQAVLSPHPEQGKPGTLEDARKLAALQAGSEVLTEIAPLGKLLKFGKSEFGRWLKEYFVRDLTGEEINTIWQAASERAIREPDKPFGEFLKELRQQMIDTAVLTAVQGGVVGAAAKAMTPVKITEFKKEITPEDVEKFYTDVDKMLAELDEKTKDIPDDATPSDVWITTKEGEIKAQPAYEITSPRAEGLNEVLPGGNWMTAEVLNNSDNWQDPNTSIPRTDRRVTRAAGDAEQIVGKIWGQIEEADLDTSKGPIVLQVGEDSDVRPAHYMKAVVEEVYRLAQKYNPNSVYVILAEDAIHPETGQKDLGYWFKHNGVHYIIPRHMTHQLESGSHISHADEFGAYNANAKLQAGSTLYHEFGHSILEDFFLAGLDNAEQQLLKVQLEEGREPDEALVEKLAPEAQGLLRRWLSLQKQMEAGEMTGHEAAARYLSPSKLQTQLMKEQFRMSEKTILKTPFPAERIVGPLKQQRWFNFFEFAAEQMAKVYFEEGTLESSAITKAMFPQGFNTEGFEAALRKFFAPVIEILKKIFGDMKVRGWIRPEAEFKAWLESLARGRPVEEGTAVIAEAKKEEVKVSRPINWESKGIQDTLRSALESVKATFPNDSRIGKLQELLDSGRYEEFVDEIEPLLGSKIKFDVAAKRAADVSGTKVADFDGKPLVVFHAPEMRWNIDGAPVWAFTPNALDANWLASLISRSSHKGALTPYKVRLMSPLEVDAAGQKLDASFVRGAIREARSSGRDGVIIRNALGYQAPIFVSLSRGNNFPVSSGEKLGGAQLRFDLTSRDGRQMATVWELAREKLTLRNVGLSLHKIARQQFNVLQMQQIAHMHPEWEFFRFWEETRVKYYRKVAQLHSPADAVVRQLEWLGKEKSALMQRFTLAEYRGGEHLTELVQTDKYHWQHRPTAKLLNKMREFGIDPDTTSGKQFLQLYIDAKNALQYQQDEMERVMLVLRGQKYRNNPRRLKQEMQQVRMQFSILRSVPFWPQQLFGSKVIQVYDADGQLVAESATDSLDEAMRMEENARRIYPGHKIVRKDRIPEEGFILRLPTEFLDEAVRVLDLDPNKPEDKEKIDQLRELMHTSYAHKPHEIYDPMLRTIRGRGGEFLRNFADFALRNSNFIAKIEFKKNFDLAARMAQDEVNKLPHGKTRDMLVAAKELMVESANFLLNPTEEAHRARATISVLYLWGHVRTAFLNLWGLVSTFGILNRELGYTKGLGQAIKAIYGGTKTLLHETDSYILSLLRRASAHAIESVTDPNWEIRDGQKSELRLALEQAKRENVLDQSYAYYLAGQAMRGQLIRAASMGALGKAFKLIIDAGMAPFRGMELLVRRISFIAFYSMLQETRPDLPVDKRYEEAVRLVGLAQGDYTKGNRPKIMRGPFMSLMTIFMTFTHNQAWGVYGGIERGFRRQEKLEGRPTPGFYRSYTVQMILLYLVAAGLEGLPFAENILDFADMVFRFTNNGKTARLTLQEWLAENLEDPEAIMRVRRGLTWNVMGMDWSRSIGLGRPLPGTDALTDQYRNPQDFIGAAILGLSGVAGGYLSWAIDTSMQLTNRWYYSGLPLGIVVHEQIARMPGGLGGMAKSALWAEVDARGPAGGLLALDMKTGRAREITQSEIVMKALGFNPSAISMAQERKAVLNESIVYWDTRRRAILDAWFYAEEILRDREAIADVRRAIAEFNSSVPFPEMAITPSTLRKSKKHRLKAMQHAEEFMPAQKMYKRLGEEVSEGFGF